MRRGKPVLVALSITALMMIWTVAPVGADSLTVAGTGASQEMLRALAKSFMAKNPGISIDVPDSIGSGGGVKAAGEDKVALGRVGRKIKDREKGYGLEYLGFAKIPLVFVANRSVTDVSNLSASQTVEIFTGKILNWSELGGPDARIRVVSRYEGDGQFGMLKKELAGWSDISVTKNSKITETDQDNVNILKNTRDTIGYATLDKALSAGLTALSLDGKSPLDKDYPLGIELALVFKPAKMTGTAKNFTDFLFSAEAGKIIGDFGGIQLSR